jgi:hypothetical protein
MPTRERGSEPKENRKVIVDLTSPNCRFDVAFERGSQMAKW